METSKDARWEVLQERSGDTLDRDCRLASLALACLLWADSPTEASPMSSSRQLTCGTPRIAPATQTRREHEKWKQNRM